MFTLRKARKPHWGLLALCMTLPLFGATQIVDSSFKEDIKVLMDGKKWKQADSLLTEKIRDIFATRMKNRVVPSEVLEIAIQKAEKKEKQKIIRKPIRYYSELNFIEENPDLFYLYINLALCKINLRDYPSAIRNFREAKRFKQISVKEKKSYAFLDYQIAIAHKALNQVDGFYEAMEQALKADPINPNYLMELGQSYGLWHHERAIQYLEKYLRTAKPDTSDDAKKQKMGTLYLNLSGLYEKKKRYLDTGRHYRSYLDLFPENGNIHYALGYIEHSKLGNDDAGLFHYEKALQYLPKEEYKLRFRIHAYAGEIFSRNGQYQKAIFHFQNTKPFYEHIDKDAQNIYQKIDKIKTDMEKVKLEILRQNDLKSQQILASYQAQLDEEKKRMESAQNLKLGYNIGKIEWNIAISTEKNGDLKGSLEAYRKAFAAGYQRQQALEKIKELEKKLP